MLSCFRANIKLKHLMMVELSQHQFALDSLLHSMKKPVLSSHLYTGLGYGLISQQYETVARYHVRLIWVCRSLDALRRAVTATPCAQVDAQHTGISFISVKMISLNC